MSLHDLVTPSRRVVITQSYADKPEVAFDVFGLTTEDFVLLVDKYPQVVGTIFIGSVKDSDNDGAGAILLKGFPDVAALIIACGCKQRDACEYVRGLPLYVKAELLLNILELTFPVGLKKSLEKIAPMIAILLKK